MPTVTPDYPADDTTADVADYNVIIQAILAVFNGHIDMDNIEPGSLTWAVMDTILGDIPATAIEDDGNLIKYRDEANVGFVASGVVVSAVSGLNGAITAGVIYTSDGKRAAVAVVTSRAFTASKDTYVDIAPDGTISYTEVANGATPPSLTADYLRVAVVVTSGSAITGVDDLAARREGEGFKLIARRRLGATRSSIVISPIPAKRHLKIVMILVATGGTVGPALQFNGDTGNNYARRSSLNGGADSSQTSVAQSSSGSTSSSAVFATAEVNNLATIQKFITATVVLGDTSAASTPDRLEWTGKWVNTSAQITRIDVTNSGTGNFAATSEVLIYGCN